MSRYLSTIATNRPEIISAQSGQWINYQGARGRYMGRRNGVVWIAWGKTASHRFARFASLFHSN
jgi:hypothetical protein